MLARLACNGVLRTPIRVFEDHPELSACLFLDRAFTNQALESLLSRLQRTDVSIATIVAACGSPVAEAVLAGAATAVNQPFIGLSALALRGASAVAASLLMASTNLTSCCFKAMENNIDLGCLQWLPKLQSLEVVSIIGVQGVENIPHLTYLQVDRAEVNCGSSVEFASTLRRLSLFMSNIDGFHNVGVSACSLLQQLTLTQACIAAAQSQHTIDIANSPAVLPTSLSALVHLTSLNFESGESLSGAVATAWVFRLSNLASLHLNFADGPPQFRLDLRLLLLSKLEHLSICFKTSRQASVLSVEVPWVRMQSLVTVELGASRLKYRESILGFTKLPLLPRP